MFRDFRRPAASTAEEWLCILRVAHRWEFRSICELALENLSPIASLVDKIVCARTLGGPLDWIGSSYATLCQRDEAITSEEGRRLGIDEVLCIYDVWRSTVRLNASSPQDVMKIIREKSRTARSLPAHDAH